MIDGKKCFVHRAHPNGWEVWDGKDICSTLVHHEFWDNKPEVGDRVTAHQDSDGKWHFKAIKDETSSTQRRTGTKNS